MKILVDVNGKELTYETDQEVKVGSVVEVPKMWWQSPCEARFKGTVTALESDYTGRCIDIHSVVYLEPPTKLVDMQDELEEALGGDDA